MENGKRKKKEKTASTEERERRYFCGEKYRAHRSGIRKFVMG
jgi:hypothetical protein